MKVDDKCEICNSLIALGEMTLHKSGRYLCADCQIDLNKEIKFRDILINRRNELLGQLSEINFELYCKGEK